MVEDRYLIILYLCLPVIFLFFSGISLFVCLFVCFGLVPIDAF